ncbi:MAG: GNAT family N-acetyltransferase [Ilumatobacteraceae bacterium]
MSAAVGVTSAGVPVPEGARIVDDPDELAAHFADRPEVHAYALGDLDEPYWSASRWFRRGDAVVGLVGLPPGDGVACYAVSTLDPAGSLALVAEIAPFLPSGQPITGPVGLARVLAAVRPLRWHAPHLRYALIDRDALPARSVEVLDLSIDDLDALAALYAIEPGAGFFVPGLVVDGVFCGVRSVDGSDGSDGPDGRLVASAGTHVLSDRRGVAAIGAVYTAPTERGRGLGRAVTSAVARRVIDRVPTVGLNVTVANSPARRIYDSIGFAPVHDYEEVVLS